MTVKPFKTIFDYRFMSPAQFGAAIHHDYYVTDLNDGILLSDLIESALAIRDAAGGPVVAPAANQKEINQRIIDSMFWLGGDGPELFTPTAMNDEEEMHPIIRAWEVTMNDPCLMGVHDFDPSTWICRKCGAGVTWINAPAAPIVTEAKQDFTPTQRAVHRAVRVVNGG